MSEITSTQIDKPCINKLDEEHIKKKRGRPRKILIPSQNINNIQSNKSLVNYIDSSTENPSIILQIPIYSSDSEITRQNHTVINDDNIATDHIQSENLIMYLTDDDTDSIPNLKKLQKELRKKDALIKKLKNLQTKREQCTENSSSKILNMSFFNSNIIDISKKNPIPEKTNIVCWWCTYNFDTIPCFIPEKYNNGKYYVYGCFCSFNCALAYVLKDDETKISCRISLLKKLYNELYNTTEILHASPPREMLQKFGGSLSIEKFRNNKNLKSKDYKMIIVPAQCYFEET